MNASRRPGPPVVIVLLLGAAILASAVTGWTIASQIQSAPLCFEACFLDSLVPTTYATIFAVSAAVNLALLPLTLGKGIPPIALPSLAGVAISQLILLALATVWVTSLAIGSPPVSFLTAMGIAGLSIVVCVLTGMAISRRRSLD